jgi:hypothetical protein
VATCQDIITRALRKLNAVQIGAALIPAEAANALTSLQSGYLELVGWGAFGRENDLLASGDWTAWPSQRVRSLAEGSVVTIPDQLPARPRWWNDAWGDDAWWLWPVYPTNGCDCCRAPDDLSVVTIVDPNANTALTFLYDAYVGRWSALEGLSLTSEAPLSRRWAEPLSNMLAGRLATDYGQEVSPALQIAIRNGLQAMSSRYSDASRTLQTDYF